MFRSLSRAFTSLSQQEHRVASNLSHLQKYRLMVGFEFHCQMHTKYKLFSSAHASYFEEPNTHLAFLDCALPGTLPVLNEECLEQALKCAVALEGEIPCSMKFDRKHYVYADLPQGYQITQKHHPVMQKGTLRYFNARGEQARVGIQRI